VFDSFFYELIYNRCKRYEFNSRYTKAKSIDNLFDGNRYRWIFTPIHSNAHWSLVVIDLHRKHLRYLDSMGRDGLVHMKFILRFLQDEFNQVSDNATKKRKMTGEEADDEEEEFNPREWKLESLLKKTPQQGNFIDCGIYVCSYADKWMQTICQNNSGWISFSQIDPWITRKQILFDLVDNRIPKVKSVAVHN